MSNFLGDAPLSRYRNSNSRAGIAALGGSSTVAVQVPTLKDEIRRGFGAVLMSSGAETRPVRLPSSTQRPSVGELLTKHGGLSGGFYDRMPKIASWIHSLAG